MSHEARLQLATDILMKQGITVFQGALMAPTEERHVLQLLTMMVPPFRARILDMGSGVGAVARIMKDCRTDLEFVLVNNSTYQLSLSPPGLPRVEADMCKVPLTSGSFDGAMFCYSLCQTSMMALYEAARLVRSGGFLFVYDYERMSGDNDLMVARLRSRSWSRETLEMSARMAGWKLDFWENPETDDTRFRENSDGVYEDIFSHLKVCVWRATRE